jgi:hypothetical protein
LKNENPKNLFFIQTKLRKELHDTVAKPKDRHYMKFGNDWRKEMCKKKMRALVAAAFWE